MDKKFIGITLAALMAAPAIAGAQAEKTNRTQQSGQSGQTGTTGQSGQTAGQVRPGDTSAGMQNRTFFVSNADKVIGMKVKSATGEDIGKIEDVVLDSNGQIAYAVLSFGGVMGMGDKLLAVPWGMVQNRAADGVALERDGLVIAVDKERLKAAPGFDKNNWPRTASGVGSPFTDTDKYFERDNTRRTMEASARTGSTSVLRVSELKGKNIETATGEKLGDIKEVVIDPVHGRVNYVVASVGGFLGVGDRQVAIPFEALRMTRAEDGKDKITLPITKEKLTTAPEFHAGEARMREMSDPVWIGRVYEFYSVRPYWTATSTDRSMNDPNRNDPNRRDDGMGGTRKEDPNRKDDPNRRDNDTPPDRDKDNPDNP